MDENFKESHMRSLYALLGHAGHYSRVGTLDYSTKKYEQVFLNSLDEINELCRRFNGKRNVFISRAFRDADGIVVGTNCISFDVDPVREKDTAAYSEQHDNAIRAGRRILSRYPGGYLASSGNGALIVYRLNTPINVNLPDHYLKEKALIQELQELVNDLNVNIDPTNYEEAVIKMIGTQSTKGEIGLRRVSQWLTFPTPPYLIPTKLLERLNNTDVTKNVPFVQANHPGWIKEAFESLLEGRTPRLIKLVGRYKHDKWSADDTLAALKPHAEAVNYDLDKLKSMIDDIYAKDTLVDIEETDDSLEGFLKDIVPTEWICEPIIAKGSIGFVAGLPETMKTWLMLDLAIECARGGGMWLGHFPVNAAKVLFVDQERYKGETQRRFKKVLAEKGIEGSSLQLWPLCGTTTRIDLEESFQAFRRKMEKIKPDLVIIDSFATFHTREENNRKDIQEVLEKIKSLRQEFGSTFLFIDHENKSVLNPEDKNPPSAFKMVGSVGKPAAAETVLTVRKESENKVEVFHTKSTLAPAVAPFKVQILDTPLGISIKHII